MKVYVVNLCYDYEGHETKGVYSTLRKAKKAAKEFFTEGFSDCVVVYETDLDTGELKMKWEDVK